MTNPSINISWTNLCKGIEVRNIVYTESKTEAQKNKNSLGIVVTWILVLRLRIQAVTPLVTSQPPVEGKHKTNLVPERE